MATLAPFFRTQFLDGNGNPLAGGRLFTYVSGTTTPKTTWVNPTETLPNENANPIILDSTGSCDLWLGSGPYTLRLETSGAVLVDTWDNITATPLSSTGSFLPLAGGTMTGAITLPGNATASLQAVPLQQLTSAVAAATPPAANVSIADAGGFYTGTNVEAALQEIPALDGRLLTTQVFTAGGTWTRPALCSFVIVEVVGGGGGSFTPGAGSGGGGAGGYAWRRVTSPGATELVTVGAGGAVGAAGGSSSFGSWASAGGGSPGAASEGGAGGTASSGDLNIPGAPGGWGGNITNNFFGHGGSGPWGGGAPPGFNRAAGIAGAPNSGGGGSGGTGSGGAGGSGVVIVYAYS